MWDAKEAAVMIVRKDTAVHAVDDDAQARIVGFVRRWRQYFLDWYVRYWYREVGLGPPIGVCSGTIV